MHFAYIFIASFSFEKGWIFCSLMHTNCKQNAIQNCKWNADKKISSNSTCIHFAVAWSLFAFYKQFSCKKLFFSSKIHSQIRVQTKCKQTGKKSVRKMGWLCSKQISYILQAAAVEPICRKNCKLHFAKCKQNAN